MGLIHKDSISSSQSQDSASFGNEVSEMQRVMFAITWSAACLRVSVTVEQRFHHLHVVVACAVSEHRSRAPVESCGVVYCTPQALSLFLESCGSCVTLHKLCHCFLSHGTLCCVSHCVCVLSSLSIVLLCIYTAVDWELPPQSHSLHCRLVASLFCP